MGIPAAARHGPEKILEIIRGVEKGFRSPEKQCHPAWVTDSMDLAPDLVEKLAECPFLVQHQATAQFVQ